MATLRIRSVTEDSITCYVSGLTSESSGYRREFDWYIDGNMDGYDTMTGSGTTSDDYTFTGLSPDTSYDIEVTVWYSSQTSGWEGSVDLGPETATTDAEEVTAWFELYNTYDTYVRFRLHLSNEFNTDYYDSAGITRNRFTSTSGVSSISGIVSYVDAGSSTRTYVNVDVPYDSVRAYVDSNDQITLYAYAQDTSGRYWAIADEYGDFGITIDVPPLTEPTLDHFSVISSDISTRNITVQYSVDDPDGVSWDLQIYANDTNSTSGGTYLGSTGGSSSVTLYQTDVTAAANKLYYVYAKLINYDTGTVLYTTGTIKVDLRKPTVTISSVTQNSGQMTANVSWTVSSTMDGMTFIVAAKYGSGSYYDKTDDLSSSTRSATISFDRTGSYTIKVTIYDSSGSVVDYDEQAVTISMQKPSAWTWTYDERWAFENKGSIKNLTQARWNEFIDAVNSCLTYKGYETGSTQTLISASYKMTNDKIMYASSFLKVVEGVNRLSSSGISTSSISKGSIIYGKYFNDLANAVNAYVNSV